MASLEEVKARARHSQALRTTAKVGHLSAARLAEPYLRVGHPGRPLSNGLTRRTMSAIRSGWDSARALAMTSKSGRIPGLAIRAHSSVQRALGAPIKRRLASLTGVAGASMSQGFTAGERRPFSARAYALPPANAMANAKAPVAKAKSANKAKAKSRSKGKAKSA